MILQISKFYSHQKHFVEPVEIFVTIRSYRDWSSTLLNNGRTWSVRWCKVQIEKHFVSRVEMNEKNWLTKWTSISRSEIVSWQLQGLEFDGQKKCEKLARYVGG
jgi:hypothetical protein